MKVSYREQQILPSNILMLKASHCSQRKLINQLPSPFPTTLTPLVFQLFDRRCSPKRRDPIMKSQWFPLTAEILSDLQGPPRPLSHKETQTAVSGGSWALATRRKARLQGQLHRNDEGITGFIYHWNENIRFILLIRNFQNIGDNFKTMNNCVNDKYLIFYNIFNFSNRFTIFTSNQQQITLNKKKNICKHSIWR